MGRALRRGSIALLASLAALPALAGDDFVYVHARRSAEIYAFAVTGDGQLEAVPGSPFATGLASSRCGGYCQAMAWSRRGRALIAAGGDGIASLVVAEDGTLSPAPGSPWSIDGDFLGTAEVRRGRYVYVNDFDTGDVHGFEVEKDGALVPVPGSPFATGAAGLNGMSAAKRVVVSVNELSGSLTAFKVGRDGSLTPGPGSPLQIVPGEDGFVYNVNLEPRGRFAYAGHCSGGDGMYGVAVRRKTAELTLLADGPFATDLGIVCGGVALSRRGRLAIALEDRDEAQVFRRARRSGSLEPLTAPQPLTGADSHALSRKGDLLVVSDSADDVVTSYAVDRKTGALTLVDQESILGARQANQTLLIRR